MIYQKRNQEKENIIKLTPHCISENVIWINRLSLFLIFFWFGIAKILAVSPAEQLIFNLHQITIKPYISIKNFLTILGIVECFIGIMWLIPKLTKFVIIIFIFQMMTTFMPLILLTNDTWKDNMVLSLSGQYIFKNIVLISCAFTIYSDCQTKGWKLLKFNFASFFNDSRYRNITFNLKKMKMKINKNSSMQIFEKIFVLVMASLTASAQSIHPLETISQHYKKNALQSGEPNLSRANMDTIQFPWKEYSKSALANSLMRTYYLNADDESKLASFVSLPANSSDQTKADLQYLMELQNSRTKTDTIKANFIAQIGSWPNIINPIDPDYKENRTQLFYIASSVGDWYNSDNFPATTQLLMNCIQDIRVTEFRLKRHFKRPRPYHLELKLKPITRINSPSFVSGHSLWAFSEAFLFAELIPEKRDSFVAKAEEVRWSRELLGIHYPSDNEGSRIIAWHLVNYWFKNPKFIADLEKAKMEWKLKSAQFNKKK